MSRITMSPGTMSDDASIGSISWSNVDYAKTDNNQYAISTVNVTKPTSLIDYSVKLVKNGTISGNNKSAGATPPTSTDTYATFGGYSDLWGLTLTPSDINNSGFGVVYSGEALEYNYNISHYLKATNFGFHIHDNATINGVLVEFQMLGLPSGNGLLVDYIRITVDYTLSPKFNAAIFFM